MQLLFKFIKLIHRCLSEKYVYVSNDIFNVKKYLRFHELYAKIYICIFAGLIFLCNNIYTASVCY